MEKDLTCVLYVCDYKTSEELMHFSKAEGFVLSQCDDAFQACDLVNSKLPDLIIIEIPTSNYKELKPQVTQLRAQALKYRPAVFLVLPHSPDSEQRVELMRCGVDDFFTGTVDPQEIKLKYEVFKRVKELEQASHVQGKKLERATQYLDQFKKELKETKTVIFEEREILNNTLKQVNQMTRERNRLNKEKQELKKRFTDNVEGWFEILSRLIENRIEKNRGHGQRVSHIADFIAKEFNIDEKKLEDLRKAAILHEAGLLLAPEAVLEKNKERLSDYEKDFFVQYPVKGADLLSVCSELQGCAEIIYHLHENSDGTGSPQGLKRKYIPLLSRILSGADVFDTLKDQENINSLEVFLEKLEGYAGTRLDPNIVSWLERYAVLHMGSDAYKVKGVGIHQLEPGMTLGTAIFTNTGTKLFSVNTLLTQDSIDKIRKYNREYPVDETVYIRA